MAVDRRPEQLLLLDIHAGFAPGNAPSRPRDERGKDRSPTRVDTLEQVDRALLGLEENAADILPEHAERDHLHPRAEQQDGNQRSVAWHVAARNDHAPDSKQPIEK